MTNSEIAEKIRNEYGVSVIIVDNDGGGAVAVKAGTSFLPSDMVDFVLKVEHVLQDTTLSWDVCCQKYWDHDPGHLLESIRDAKVAREAGYA